MAAPEREKKLSRPTVTANFGLTWDGRISTRNHTPSDFSSPRDKQRLLEIRAEGDAVLASAKTVSADRMTMGMPDPELRAARTARGQTPYPLRVLLTNSGKINPAAEIFQKDFSPIAVFSTTKMPQLTREALAEKATLHLSSDSAVDLSAMLQTLADRYAVRHVVCEGGAQIFRALLAADLIDALHVTFCPRIFGGKKAPTLTGLAGEFLPASVSLSLETMEVIEKECFLKYRVVRT